MADADPAVSSAPGDWTHLSELAADAHIYVTIRDGSQASGRFKQLTEESIEVTVSEGEAKSISRADVLRIHKKEADMVWEGMLIGTAVGFFAGGWLEGIIWHGGAFYTGDDYARAFRMGGALAGMAIGAGADASIGKKVVLYEAD